MREKGDQDLSKTETEDEGPWNPNINDVADRRGFIGGAVALAAAVILPGSWLWYRNEDPMGDLYLDHTPVDRNYDGFFGDRFGDGKEGSPKNGIREAAFARHEKGEELWEAFPAALDSEYLNSAEPSTGLELNIYHHGLQEPESLAQNLVSSVNNLGLQRYERWGIEAEPLETDVEDVDEFMEEIADSGDESGIDIFLEGERELDAGGSENLRSGWATGLNQAPVTEGNPLFTGNEALMYPLKAFGHATGYEPEEDGTAVLEADESSEGSIVRVVDPMSTYEIGDGEIPETYTTVFLDGNDEKYSTL